MKETTETTFRLSVEDIKDAIIFYIGAKKHVKVEPRDIKFDIQGGLYAHELSGATAIAKNSSSEYEN